MQGYVQGRIRMPIQGGQLRTAVIKNQHGRKNRAVLILCMVM